MPSAPRVTVLSILMQSEGVPSSLSEALYITGNLLSSYNIKAYCANWTSFGPNIFPDLDFLHNISGSQEAALVAYVFCVIVFNSFGIVIGLLYSVFRLKVKMQLVSDDGCPEKTS